MQLGMHTYSLYHHGVAEDWAGFKLPPELQDPVVIEGDLLEQMEKLREETQTAHSTLKDQIKNDQDGMEERINQKIEKYVELKAAVDDLAKTYDGLKADEKKTIDGVKPFKTSFEKLRKQSG